MLWAALWGWVCLGLAAIIHIHMHERGFTNLRFLFGNGGGKVPDEGKCEVKR